MKYQKLTQNEKNKHPSIHYTGSVRGMKKLSWKKDDVCVRCGQYIYNLSITIPNNKDSDQVLEFTSELTGLSIDRLIEKLNELNQKDNDNDSCNM